MGRTEPSQPPVAQQSFRKEQRAKHAKATINKTIPQVLGTDARARKGIGNAQLITDPVGTAKAGNCWQGSSTALKDDKVPKKKRNQDASFVPLTASETPDEVVEPPMDIRIQVTDTLLAARTLHQQSRSRKNVAILNMASPLRPGGGVLSGATSQEESLCVRTTLLISLKDHWYRLPDLGGIWAPDVIVFRLPGRGADEELSKADRFYVDVITSAMTRFPDIVEKPSKTKGQVAAGNDQDEKLVKAYAADKDRELALDKMRAVLHILQSQGTERVVFGAWGCGAYGNPVAEIARAWKKALLGNSAKSGKTTSPPPSWAPLKEVIFAIKDARMAQEFAEYWGEGMEVHTPDKPSREKTEDGTDDQNAEELRRKIESLELQARQVRTPMMKESLESTIMVLKAQLPSTQDSSGAEDEEGIDED